MQGGYETYPAKPTPDPKKVGEELMGMSMEQEAPAMDVDPSLQPPTPSPMALANSGGMSGEPSLTSAVGGALQREMNGVDPQLPERMFTADSRLAQYLALGMHPEEAQMMMLNGGG